MESKALVQSAPSHSPHSPTKGFPGSNPSGIGTAKHQLEHAASACTSPLPGQGAAPQPHTITQGWDGIDVYPILFSAWQELWILLCSHTTAQD